MVPLKDLGGNDVAESSEDVEQPETEDIAARNGQSLKKLGSLYNRVARL